MAGVFHKTKLIAVSIHAPVKGATDLTLHEKIFIAVSIHAPVKGATMTFRSQSGLS